MAAEKKKETRIMKVTLDEEEFQKYDQGLVRFNKGSRRASDGKLSALPDIEPLDPAEDKQAEIALQETILEMQRQKNLEQEIRLARAEAGLAQFQFIVGKLGALADYLIENPDAVESIKQAGRKARNAVVSTKTKLSSKIKQIPKAINHTPFLSRKNKSVNSVEIINEPRDRITISEEQAELLIVQMREKAEELAKMISLWSMIAVKDEKSEVEYVLEQNFVEKFLTDEMHKTIETLVSKRNLLDESTQQTFSDFLDGFLSYNGKRVPIPVMIGDNSTVQEQEAFAVPEEESLHESIRE